jgi:hypothetical protein
MKDQSGYGKERSCDCGRGWKWFGFLSGLALALRLESYCKKFIKCYLLRNFLNCEDSDCKCVLYMG